MTKRVAIIGTRGYPSYYGGFETLVRKLVPYFIDQGWNVTVYSRGQTDIGKIPDDAKLEIRSTWGIDSKSISTLSFGLSASVDAALRRPDVALVMNVANGYWLPLLRARRIPTIVNVDGIEWERDKWGKVAKYVFENGARMTARNATALVADSQQIQNRWMRDFSKNTHFIPYGGDAVGKVATPDGLERRRYVLLVARFVPENTVPEFLQAAQEISKNYDVVIVGSSGYGGPIDDSVKRMADENARVHWYGHLRDDAVLYALWNNAGLYFHGHSVGGTNPALVQAMACGAPILARNTPYNREVLGDAGWYTEPSANAILSSAMARIQNAEALEEAATNAAIRALELYTWERVCNAYEGLASTVMKNADWARS